MANHCPLCGDENIYENFFDIECTTVGCKNYSKHQAQLVLELEASVEVEEEEQDKDTITIPTKNTTTLRCGPGYPDADSELDWLIPPIT